MNKLIGRRYEQQQRLYLIHELINEGMTMEDKRKLIDTATEVMLEVFAGPSEVFTTKVTHDPIHLLHVQKLCKNAKDIKYSSPKLLQLKVCMFQCYMSGTRDFKSAESIQKEIETDLKVGLILPPYYEALFKYNKGFLAAISTHYDEAIHSMKEGLAIFEASKKFPGEYENEILCALTNLMQYYDMRGETEKAEALIPQAKEMFQSSKSLVSKGTFMYALGLVRIDQGRFQDAEEILNKTKDYPTLRAERPPIYHGILVQKIIAFMKQGKLSEALRVLDQYNKDTKEFFQGRSNTALSHALLLQSLIEMQKGQVSPDALPNLEQALLIYNGFFKGEKKQRLQARTYFAMGKAYDLQKDHPNALQHYLVSDQIYNNILKNKEIDDVSELYTALALLGAKGEDEELTHKYLKAQVQTFGLAHPRTQEIMLYLNKKGLSVPF